MTFFARFSLAYNFMQIKSIRDAIFGPRRYNSIFDHTLPTSRTRRTYCVPCLLNTTITVIAVLGIIEVHPT